MAEQFFLTAIWFLAIYGAAVAVTAVKGGWLGQQLACMQPGRVEEVLIHTVAAWSRAHRGAPVDAVEYECLRRKALWSTGIPFLRGVFSCPVCFAFWFAAGASLLLWGPTTGTLLGTHPAVAAVCDGLAAGGAVFSFHALVLRIAPPNF